MRIADRKPRATRFEADNAEVRLARLREQAPTLGSSRKMRVYALLGSLLMVLTVAAFYFAMQIYKAVGENRTENALIQVDQAPEITESEVKKALKRVEAESEAEDEAYQEQLQALKEVDLLEETPPEKG